jgi:hypothetical protein
MTTLTMTETEQTTAHDMDTELGIYVPAGVTDNADLRLYDEFFSLCRQCVFLYSLLTLEEVKQLFIEFYNYEYIEKVGVNISLKNKIETYLSMLELDEEDTPDKFDDTRTDIYLEQPDKQSKAATLYFFDHGYAYQREEELVVYLQIVDEIERASQEYVAQLEAEGAGDEHSVVDSSPEEVVSRYLKGSGVYDPALRNTGFRVDTDIEKANGPQV